MLILIGLAGLLVGIVAGAAAVLGLLVTLGAARLERHYPPGPGTWHITDEVDGTCTNVVLVRQTGGRVTGRVVVDRVDGQGGDCAERYLAARQEADRRLEWLSARREQR